MLKCSPIQLATLDIVLMFFSFFPCVAVSRHRHMFDGSYFPHAKCQILSEMTHVTQGVSVQLCYVGFIFLKKINIIVVVKYTWPLGQKSTGKTHDRLDFSSVTVAVCCLISVSCESSIELSDTIVLFHFI